MKLTKARIDRLMAVIGLPNRVLWRLGSARLTHAYWRFTCRLWNRLYQRAGV